MQSLLYDLRFALRQLRKNLGIAVLAILTLALGVGANTAIFTVIDGVLLRPLPYADSGALVAIGMKSEKPSFVMAEFHRYTRPGETAGERGGIQRRHQCPDEPGYLDKYRRPAVDAQPLFYAGSASAVGAHVQPGRGDRRGAAGGGGLGGSVAGGFPRRSAHPGTGDHPEQQILYGHRRHARLVQVSRADGTRSPEGGLAAAATDP